MCFFYPNLHLLGCCRKSSASRGRGESKPATFGITSSGWVPSASSSESLLACLKRQHMSDASANLLQNWEREKKERERDNGEDGFNVSPDHERWSTRLCCRCWWCCFGGFAENLRSETGALNDQSVFYSLLVGEMIFIFYFFVLASSVFVLRFSLFLMNLGVGVLQERTECSSSSSHAWVKCWQLLQQL